MRTPEAAGRQRGTALVVIDRAAAGVAWVLAHDVPGPQDGICLPRRAGRQAGDGT